MSTNDLPSLQKQINHCRDFCVGINFWITLNKYAVEQLKKAIDAASASNTLKDFQPIMRHHWKSFDELTKEAIFLLESHKSGFQSQARSAEAAMNKLGERAQLHNHIQGGLVDNIKNL